MCIRDRPKSRQEALDAAVRRQAARIESAMTGKSATDFDTVQGIIADTPAATTAGGRVSSARGAEVANPVPATPPVTDPNSGLPSLTTSDSVAAKADLK